MRSHATVITAVQLWCRLKHGQWVFDGCGSTKQTRSSAVLQCTWNQLIVGESSANSYRSLTEHILTFYLSMHQHFFFVWNGFSVLMRTGTDLSSWGVWPSACPWFRGSLVNWLNSQPKMDSLSILNFEVDTALWVHCCKWVTQGCKQGRVTHLPPQSLRLGWPITHPRLQCVQCVRYRWDFVTMVIWKLPEFQADVKVWLVPPRCKGIENVSLSNELLVSLLDIEGWECVCCNQRWKDRRC